MIDDSGESAMSPSEAEWLSLLRYQLSVAIEQSRLVAPLNVLAINTLQDCVEGLLSLAGEHLRVDMKKRVDFLQLFDAVVGGVGDPSSLVGFRKPMESMNSARVSFKHHGNPPSEATLRRHVNRAREFMEELTMAVFRQPLDSVSLLLFVRNDDVRSFLEAARTEWSAGNDLKAMELLRLAFDMLVGDFERRKVWRPGSSLFSTKPSFAPSRHDFRELGRPIEKMMEWLENIDRWVRNLALGVDMRRYAYFDAHCPVASYSINGGHHVYVREGVSITEEVFDRSFKFVVDTALSFAVEDFDFDAWTARRQVDTDECQ